MTEPTVHVYPDLAALCARAAADTVALVRRAPEAARFALVLAGGGTPRLYHQQLATTYREALPWTRLHLFWGDERFVPPDDPNSNFGMARDTLLRHVPIPEANLHRVRTELATPEAAAADLERELHAFFDDAAPAFDLTILGLGTDGHTASLFPGSPAVDETARWALAAQAPPGAPVPDRITLTLPALNQSRNIFFLTAGTSKHAPFRAILDDPAHAARRYPAAGVTAQSTLAWYVDEAAYRGT